MTDEHNVHEDFDPNAQAPEFGHDGDPVHSSGATGKLGNAWRTQPLFKLLVLMTVVGAVVAASVTFFSGSSTPTDISKLVRPTDMNEAPGGHSSPYVSAQTKAADAHRADAALENGGSAIPTPLGSPTEIGDGNDHKNDPLNELRAETERLKAQVVQVQQQQVQPQAAPAQPEQFDDSLAQAMQHEMQQLNESWTPRGMKLVSGAKDDVAEAAKNALANAAQAATAGGNLPVPQPKALVAAGTVSYAQLLTEANSDVPGTILAQIVSGPLSGARAIGEFKVDNDYLVLEFHLANLKGKDYPIKALALDPDTTLGGMATEYDGRYFIRVVLPAAASFMQALGQQMAQPGQTMIQNGTSTIATTASAGFKQGTYAGLGGAATTVGEFLKNEANNTKPLVRVASGTPMGLFFVASVFDPDKMPAPTQTQTYGGPTMPNGYYPVPPMTGGYPGSIVSGYGADPSAANVPYPSRPTGMTPAGYPSAGFPTGYGLPSTGVKQFQ